MNVKRERLGSEGLSVSIRRKSLSSAQTLGILGRVMKPIEVFLLALSMFIVGLLLSAGVFLNKARAQEHEHHADGSYGVGHSDYHAFYKEWKDAKGGSCCSASDCRPSEHRTIGEKVQVKVDGEWVDVPPEKIRPYASPDMGTHVCAPPASWGMPKGHIYCVVIGSGV